MDDERYRAALERLAGRSPAMSKRKQHTRRRIVGAASQLFRERGVRRTSMEEVAEAAGVSRATLYTYADNKHDLLIKALAEEQLEHGRPRFSAEGPPGDRLRQLIAESIAAFQRMPLLSLLVKGDPEVLRSLEHHPEVRAAFPLDDMSLVASLVMQVSPGLTSERARAYARAIHQLTTVGPYLMDSALRDGASGEAVAGNLADLLVCGLESAS